jgi:hypothetical protein
LGESTTRGKLVLITQFVVSAAMNDMKPEIGTKMVDSMRLLWRECVPPRRSYRN